MSIIRRILVRLGLACDHDDITRFRGLYTRGVECLKCGRAELLEDWNDGTEPMGWWNESE